MQAAGVVVNLIADNFEHLLEPRSRGRIGPDRAETGEGFEQMDVGILRFEAVARADRVGRTGSAVEDRISISGQGFEVAAVWSIVGMVVEPAKGLFRQIEGGRIARGMVAARGGEDAEGHAVGVLSADPRRWTAGDVDGPEESALLPIPKFGGQERHAMASRREIRRRSRRIMEAQLARTAT